MVGMPEGTTTPLDELAGFLSGNSAASVSPQNPLNQNAAPSANPSNPNMNKDIPGSWTNPSNPELNPNLPGAVNNPSNPKYNPSMPGATNNPSNYDYNPAMPGSLTNPASPQLNPDYPGSLMNPANPIHNPNFPVHQEIPRPPGLSDNASLPPAHASWHEAFGVSDILGINSLKQKLQQRFREFAQANPEMFNGAAAAAAIEQCLAEYEAEMNQLPPVHASYEEGSPERAMQLYLRLKNGDPSHVRGYIAAHPWRPGQWGKAVVTPTGRPITWSTVPDPYSDEDDDGFPFHEHAVNALGYGGRYAPAMRDVATIDPGGNVETYLQNEQDRLQDHVNGLMSSQQVVSRWYLADNYTQDTREWPDPTEPRASEPPAPHGCTCRNGTDSVAKLYCPIHGLDGQWEEARDWSIPEGHPVGYPEDQPRGWTDAVHSKALEGRAVREDNMGGPWNGVHDSEGVQKHTDQEGDYNPGHDDKNGVDQRHGGNLPIKRPVVKYPKFVTTREQHERGKRRWSLTPKKPKQSAMDPRHLDEYQEHSLNGPYLYHATTPDAAEAILREGLYPHDQIEGGEHDLLHCPNCGFTTHPIPGDRYYRPEAPCPQCSDDYLREQKGASQYAGEYYEPRPGHTYMGDFGMVTNQYFRPNQHQLLRIDMRKLDPSKMNADEDAFNPSLRSYSNPVVERVLQDEPPPDPESFGEHGMTFGQWADQANLGQDPAETHHSLFAHGSIAYNGVVPPEAIEEADPRSGLAMRQPTQAEPVLATIDALPATIKSAVQEAFNQETKVREQEGKITALDHTLRNVVASIQQKPQPKQPRKLTIHRDDTGRMAAISHLDAHENRACKLVIHRDENGRMSAIEEVT